jgi:molybdenum cofactor biosynthesis protein B
MYKTIFYLTLFLISISIDAFSLNSFDPFPKKESTRKNDKPVTVAILIASDSRSCDSCSAGLYAKKSFEERGHNVQYFVALKNEQEVIEEQIKQWVNENIEIILTIGGTGFTKRDTTIEAVEKVIERQMPGFGQLFRFLSYNEVINKENDVRVWVACGSRASAGTINQSAIFAIPGSPHAVKLAMDQIILDLICTLSQRLKE